MKHKLIITVDGPAGAGKSTVSRALSQKISYLYLDTGALYRAVAYKVAERGIAPDDEKRLSKLCGEISISLQRADGEMRILVDGDDLTDKIRTEEIGFLASSVSAVPVVREALLPIQRNAGETGGVVAEGRDMATVVFPHADIKFFLSADIPERARRRYKELLDRGKDVDFEEIKESLVKRDSQDSEREISPLMVTEDAIVIDSTTLKKKEVVEKMVEIIENYILNRVK